MQCGRRVAQIHALQIGSATRQLTTIVHVMERFVNTLYLQPLMWISCLKIWPFISNWLNVVLTDSLKFPHERWHAKPDRAVTNGPGWRRCRYDIGYVVNWWGVEGRSYLGKKSSEHYRGEEVIGDRLMVEWRAAAGRVNMWSEITKLTIPKTRIEDFKYHTTWLAEGIGFMKRPNIGWASFGMTVLQLLLKGLIISFWKKPSGA